MIPPSGRAPGGHTPGGRESILVASFNPGKARELQALVAAAGYTVTTLRDAGIEAPYVETGLTYEDNGAGKARHYAMLTGRVTVADDSGIEVDALDGAPGVFSARYGGEGIDDAERNRRLLRALESVPEERRGARYVAVAVVAHPDGATRAFRGECEGRIATTPTGDGGFGYDPLFFYPPFNQTFGQTPAARKHEVSHRGRAFRALAAWLGSEEGRRFMEGRR